MDFAKIVYSGFYDTPLAFVVSYRDEQYLFLRDFDDVIDDFPQVYKVLVLPTLTRNEIMGRWQELDKLATAYPGEIPVECVHFDPTKRVEMDTTIIRETVEEKGGQRGREVLAARKSCLSSKIFCTSAIRIADVWFLFHRV